MASNPLEALTRPKELDPRQPKASHERFVKTLAKCDQVDPKGRLRCMLALARYTGRRGNAICQLRASDVLWDKEAVLRRIAALGSDENKAEFYPEGGDPLEGGDGQDGHSLPGPLERPCS